jgi:hypothetical protein
MKLPVSMGRVNYCRYYFRYIYGILKKVIKHRSSYLDEELFLYGPPPIQYTGNYVIYNGNEYIESISFNISIINNITNQKAQIIQKFYRFYIKSPSKDNESS